MASSFLTMMKDSVGAGGNEIVSVADSFVVDCFDTGLIDEKCNHCGFGF